MLTWSYVFRGSLFKGLSWRLLFWGNSIVGFLLGSSILGERGPVFRSSFANRDFQVSGFVRGINQADGFEVPWLADWNDQVSGLVHGVNQVDGFKLSQFARGNVHGLQEAFLQASSPAGSPQQRACRGKQFPGTALADDV